MNIRNIRPASLKKAKGFTLVELIVVIAIGALLALFAVPYARGVIINGKVEPTANDINKTVTSIRGNFAGQGVTPYNNLGVGAAATAIFANTARGLSSALTVSGNGAAATVHRDPADGEQCRVPESGRATVARRRSDHDQRRGSQGRRRQLQRRHRAERMHGR